MTASPSKVPQAKEKKNLIQALKISDLRYFPSITRIIAATNPSIPSEKEVRIPNPHI